MIRDEIFVFGSNTAGRHGKGAALTARKHWGAVYGQGEGPQGRSYAIPTKDHDLKVRSLYLIHESVDRFVRYALAHPDQEFFVTKIGCGLAGYKETEIAPMFVDAPRNCQLPEGWRK